MVKSGGLVLAALALLPATADAQSAKGVGEKAPSLSDVEWLQGRPVKRFKRGTTYVVDFWSTWAGVSRNAWPYLQELRASHAKSRVEFVSVAVWPRMGAILPKAFIENRPELFDHTVARDVSDKTVKAYAALIDLEQIPRAVIIDKKGLIAWAGYPFDGLDEALAAVLDQDDDALAAVNSRYAALHEEARPHHDAWFKGRKYKIWSRVDDSVAALLELDEKRFAYTARSRYEALLQLGHDEQAAAFGRRLVDEILHDYEWELDNLAWSIVRDRKDLEEEQLDLDLALAAAERANELAGGQDWSILDTLARVHFRRGNADEAITTQRRSLDAAFSSEQRELSEEILASYLAEKPPPDAARPYDG